jgi:hypothetical protein
LILPEGMASVLFSYVYHKDRSAEQNRWQMASSLDDMLHWEGYTLRSIINDK